MRDWFKQFCMRYIPTEVLAWLHGRRFVRLVHKLKQDPETAILNKLLKPGDVVIDVGANGANWTYFLSRAVGPEGRVLAFEADPYYARATGWAIRHMRLRNTTLFPFGLSDRMETVYLRTIGDTGARLSGTSSVDREDGAEARGTPVQLVTLDSLIKERPELAEARLIKCDVEGYEWFVLKGTQKILKKARPVLIFEMGWYEAQGYLPEDLCGWLKDRHYEIFALARNGLLVTVDTGLRHPDAATVNRVALPGEHMMKYRTLLPIQIDVSLDNERPIS